MQIFCICLHYLLFSQDEHYCCLKSVNKMTVSEVCETVAIDKNPKHEGNDPENQTENHEICLKKI